MQRRCNSTRKSHQKKEKEKSREVLAQKKTLRSDSVTAIKTKQKYNRKRG